MIFGRYLVASLFSLMVDVSVLSLLVARFSFNPDIAAGIGYTAGACAHYLLSRRVVFQPGWLRDVRWLEFGAFVVSGFCGLMVTILVVATLTDRLGAPLALAKAVAVAASFVAVYLLRAKLIFRPVVR